jgi:hypothetical protein
MGYDKYGINWKVWGQTASAKPVLKTSAPVSSQPAQEKKKETPEPEQEIAPSPKTVTLRNPKFNPDTDTKIGCSCKVSVAITTEEKSGNVQIELIAKYKGKLYQLGQSNLRHDGQNATGTITLDSVDEYTKDSEKQPPDPSLSVDYYFNASALNAQSVTSPVLVLPYIDKKTEQIQKCSANNRAGAASEGGCAAVSCDECPNYKDEEEATVAPEVTKEEAQQAQAAQNICEAAKDGAPMACNCATCKDAATCESKK